MKHYRRAAFALLLALLNPAAARAESGFDAWDTPTKDGLACKFVVRFEDGHSTFLAMMTQDPKKRFISFFLTNYPDVDGLRVSLFIDDELLIRFTKASKSAAGDEVGAYSAASDDGFQARLKLIEAGVQSFQILIGDHHLAMPVEGLRKAAADYIGCRQHRWS